MPTCIIEIAGTEFELDFDAKVTFRGYPARLSGPPEDCYPAEAMEYEVSGVRLFKLVRRDHGRGVPPSWERGDEVAITDEWLRSLLTEYAYESDEARDAVEEEAEEDRPRRRRA